MQRLDEFPFYRVLVVLALNEDEEIHAESVEPGRHIDFVIPVCTGDALTML